MRRVGVHGSRQSFSSFRLEEPFLLLFSCACQRQTQGITTRCSGASPSPSPSRLSKIPSSVSSPSCLHLPLSSWPSPAAPIAPFLWEPGSETPKIIYSWPRLAPSTFFCTNGQRKLQTFEWQTCSLSVGAENTNYALTMYNTGGGIARTDACDGSTRLRLAALHPSS